MSKYYITTTGLSQNVEISDLGGRSFVHPVTNYEITKEFSIDELRGSEELGNQISGGTIVLLDSTGYSLSDVNDIMYVTGLSGTGDIGELISNSLSGASPSFIDVYDSIGGLTTNNTNWSAYIPFDTQRIIDSPFEHSVSLNNSEITIKETDSYLVLGRLSVMATTNSRSQCEVRLEINKGVIWEPVLGTVSTLYNRMTNFGATGNFVSILNINKDDKLRVSFRRSVGGTSLRTIADGSSLVIAKLRGPKGEKGDEGTATGLTHDRQMIYKEVQVSTVSSSEIELDGMSITVKDLGGPTNYKISFSASRMNNSSNRVNYFYICHNENIVLKKRMLTYANEIHSLEMSAIVSNANSGDKISIKFDAQGGGTNSVFERVLSVDGILEENII